MPFNAIQEYDAATAGNNGDIGGINIAEQAPFSGMNNALRELCKQVRRAVANQGSDIASATTTDIGASNGQYVKVTGTTTITGLGTVNAGTMRWVEFTGILTLTHAASLKLPGSANITTANGDVGCFVSLGSGNWKSLVYQKADGSFLGSISAGQIPNDLITYAKLQNVSAASRLLGRGSAGGAGDVEELTISTGLTLTGTTLTATGKLAQRFRATLTAKTTVTTVIPFDSSTPQNDEGDEIFSQAITPKNASSTIRIRAVIYSGGSTTIQVAAALFSSASASALTAAPILVNGTTGIHPIVIDYETSAGSTAARTYSVRCGPASGTMRLNGTATDTNLFGSSLVSSFEIEEILP